MDSINNGSQQPEGGAEKKPKRPRISHVPSSAADSTTEGGAPRYERINYNRQHDSDAESGAQRPYQPRQYQPRPYGQNRPQGGYNRQGGYNNYNRQQPDGAGYQPRNYHNPETSGEGVADGENGQQQYQGGYQPRQYQPRPYGQNRPQGGYNNRQGVYNNQNRQGGYNNRQGGYNNQNRQGGYNNRQGGYNNQNRQDGYNNQNRQGGYNNPNRQGGYNNQNRQGGYNNRQGGYNNQNRKPYNNRQQQNGMPNRGKSFVPRPKRIEYEMPIPDPNEQIRLNKFISNAGICSRREADEFIQQGLVKVNGQVVTELGTKITHSDVVEYDEKVVALESKCYILLNKPKDCVTTSDDPNGRTTVMDLVKGACTERIYPVGRLDRNTTGVLLLTNDGDLASKLTHPKYIKKKIYHVWTDKDISEEDMQRIADGIELEDGPIHADEISYATETDRNQAGIAIHSGRNRIVRRIFEALGYHVTKLDRVYFAGLTKKNLPRGRWRYLTQEEVNYLKMGSFE